MNMLNANIVPYGRQEFVFYSVYSSVVVTTFLVQQCKYERRTYRSVRAVSTADSVVVVRSVSSEACVRGDTTAKNNVGARERGE